MQALVKRCTPSGLDIGQCGPHGPTASPFSMDTILTSSLRRRLSSPDPEKHTDGTRKESSESGAKIRQALCKQIEVNVAVM